jgi:hypothetical protein
MRRETWLGLAGLVLFEASSIILLYTHCPCEGHALVMCNKQF